LRRISALTRVVVLVSSEVGGSAGAAVLLALVGDMGFWRWCGGVS